MLRDSEASIYNHFCLNIFFRISQLLLLSFVAGTVYAQSSISSVDLRQIKQNKVRNFIVKQQNQQIEYFSDLEVSVHQDDDLTNFMNYEKIFTVKAQSDEVWDMYKYSCQTDVWDINRVSVGMLFSKRSQTVFYADQDIYGLEEGQIYYLNLKILNGFYNLPVVFEIINVDYENKLFEFSYLKGGKAQGKQTIQFIDTEDGNTRIIHNSFVKSKSKFRDKYLYPFFHNKIINEFHGNMRRLIAENSKNRKNRMLALR